MGLSSRRSVAIVSYFPNGLTKVIPIFTLLFGFAVFSKKLLRHNNDLTCKIAADILLLAIFGTIFTLMQIYFILNYM